MKKKFSRSILSIAFILVTFISIQIWRAESSPGANPIRCAMEFACNIGNYDSSDLKVVSIPPKNLASVISWKYNEMVIVLEPTTPNLVGKLFITLVKSNGLLIKLLSPSDSGWRPSKYRDEIQKKSS